MYVHADLHGAASVIVKNNSSDSIPATTLSQAGTMSVVQSKAWDSKIITSAWWVTPSQVSKTAPSGEYLTTGSFMIRGKKVIIVSRIVWLQLIYSYLKNWLPPIQLVYGYGLLFRVDETSVGRHFHERRPWLRNQESVSSVESSAEDVSNLQIEKDTVTQTVSNEHETESLVVSRDDDDDGQEFKQDSKDEDNDSMASIERVNENAEFGSCNQKDSQEDLSRETNESEISEPELHDGKGSETPDGNNSSRKKYLTAKERRDLKKKNNVTVAEEKQNTSPRSSLASKDPNPESSTTKPLPRGKKGKLKKMKEKYKDQDEEEKELILEFLGASQGAQPKGKKAKQAALKKAQAEEFKAKRQKERKDTSLDDVQNKEHEEVKKLLEEENVALPDEDQMADLTYLDSLTGEPHPDDILLHAIPVCAPWTALQKYKYRVKLTPGNLKKGKAAKSVLTTFVGTASGEESKRQMELVRAINDNEVIASILGKVKISGTGTDSSKKKGKK